MSLRGRLKKQLIHIHNRDRGKKTAEDDTNFHILQLTEQLIAEQRRDQVIITTLWNSTHDTAIFKMDIPSRVSSVLPEEVVTCLDNARFVSSNDIPNPLQCD
jgi:hypothetical protein